MKVEPRIRKIVTVSEELLVEGGREVEPPLKLAGGTGCPVNPLALL